MSSTAERARTPTPPTARSPDVDLDVKADPTVRPPPPQEVGRAQRPPHRPARQDHRPPAFHPRPAPARDDVRTSGAAPVARRAPASVDPALMRPRQGSRRLLPRRRRARTRRGGRAARLPSRDRWAEQDALPDEDDLDDLPSGRPHEDVPWPTTDSADAGPRTRHGPRDVQQAVHRPRLDRPQLRRRPLGGRRALSVWSHSQGIFRLRDAIAQVVGLDPHAVRVEHVPGRRLLRAQRRRRRRARRGAAGPRGAGHPVLTQWSRRTSWPGTRWARR